MARIGGQCRALWNYWLGENKKRYESDKKYIFHCEMSRGITELRKQPKFSSIPGRCAQMTVKNLDRALKESFATVKNKKGAPKFKAKGHRSDSFQFNTEMEIRGNEIKAPILGWVRVRGLSVPTDARLVQVTVRQARCAEGWEAFVQFEVSTRAAASTQLPGVGVDFGLVSAVVTSNGQKFSAPRLFRKQQKRLRRIQRSICRSKMGSANRKRKVRAFGKVHGHVANQRKDWQHKLTTELVCKHSGVAVETLPLKGLCRTKFAKSFYDVGLGEIRCQIKYKCDWYGRQFLEFPTFQRSTGVCPDCGLVGPKLPLSVREWKCSGCGAVHDRDVASARVVLKGGKVLQGMEEPAPKERKARFCRVSRGPPGNGRSSGSGSPKSSIPLAVQQDENLVSLKE